MDRDIGYNINEGGTGGWKIDVSGENNPMYGVHRYGALNPNYGKTWSEESRIKQRKTIAENGGHHGDKNPMFGRKQSEEAKRKISEANKGRVGAMAGRTGDKHPCYGLHWWCDGINRPVKAKEQPSPLHHLGRK